MFDPSDPFDNRKHFMALKNGWGIQPIGKFSSGGDIHDTFNVNKDGNIFGGHTTIRLPYGEQKKLLW